MSTLLSLLPAGNLGGAGEGAYVEDVFSTYLYTGNGGTQNIQNGIALESGDYIYSVENKTFTSIGSAIHSSYPLSNINDGVAETSNGSNLTYVSDGNFDVYVDLETPQVVVAYLIAPQGTADSIVYNTPLNFKVHGSDDGSTWTEIEYFQNISTDYPNWNAGSFREFSFTNETAYRYWRFDHLGDGSNSSGVAISELRFKVSGGDTEGKGGLVWIKNRDAAVNHQLHDTERGVGVGLNSNNTNAEYTDANSLTAFNSNGFTVGPNNYNSHNQSGVDFASWTFAKQEKFFDVVTYTGNGTNDHEISHNLGSVPGCIIVKCTSAANDWAVYHRGADATNPSHKVLFLNSTSSLLDNSTYWRDTPPTSTNFTLGTNTIVNQNGQTYVAYLFAHNDGDGIFGENGNQDIIKCGSYTGNGNSQGPLVSLGWEPQWVLIKGTSASAWFVMDTQRKLYYGGYDTTGGEDGYLELNSSASESTPSDIIDLNGDGFQPAYAGGDVNTNGNTYIYIAIRNGPMAVPTTATEVFHTELISGTATGGEEIYSPFPPDLIIEGQTASNNNKFWASRHTGEYFYGGGHGPDYWKFDGQGGQVYYPSDRTGSPILYFFRRAPQFCDVTAYQGTANVITVPHNLGVAPEMMLIFNRFGTYTRNIWVGDAGLNGLTPYGTTGTIQTNTNFFNSTAPTATEITIGNNTEINATASDYDVYMFATLAGISKVGTFSHTAGTATDVDCGFSTGARFVMWRRYDGSDYLNLFDTKRGIVAGDEPYFQMSTTGGQITDDLIDPLSSGFTVSSDSVNATGNYFFLAIA